jgi:hypothetical protein
MKLSELLDEILSEWSYRLDNGTPDTKNIQHIRMLSEVLDSLGYSNIKNEFIQNLLEVDKQFSNPALNKVIKYKNVNGEDAEGKVGNLLRRPKEEDAYKKAVATLGGEDSDGYMKAMDDLGGEGQPQRDIEKEREKTDDVGAVGDEKEPQTATAFDKNTVGGKEYLKGLPDEDPAKPAEMKDDSEETLSAGGVVYSVGGGYYADSPGGKPKYKDATDEGIDTHDFRYILETETTGKVIDKKSANNGEMITVTVIDDTEAKTAEQSIEYDKLSATEKAKMVDEKIKKNNEDFKNSRDKELFTLSSIKKRNIDINYNIMLPPGNVGSSFAETNGAYYIDLIFSSNGNISKADEEKILKNMLSTPLAQSMNEKDAKRWANIALQTAKTEANTLLNNKKYNALIPQPDGFPLGSTMDKQNKASV